MIRSFVSGLGRSILSFMMFLGGTATLFVQMAREFFVPPIYIRLTIEQVYHIGTRSLGLVIVTAIAVGMVMALQFGLGLEQFGAKLYIPRIVALSFVREIGPVFTSLMVAARVGAGITSEIGSMVVTQQVDAIRALATSPIKRIVIPRVLGALIALPLLAGISNVIGIVGGLVVGVVELDLDPVFYFNKVIETVTFTDYMTGIGKVFFFAFIISLVSCYIGLTVAGGTRGVGIATTRSVVASSIMILISDYFLTKLFFVLFES